MNRLSLINLELIFDKLSDITSINYKKINRCTNKLEIKYLEDGDVCSGLTNKIILRYPNLRSMNLGKNRKVTEINHLRKLKKLDASWDSGIDDKGIQGLKLINLKVWGNKKITDVSEITSLRELNAGGGCRINDFGIRGLKLVGIPPRGCQPAASRTR